MLLWYFMMMAADVLCWWNESVDAQSMLLIEISLMKQNSKSRYRPKRSVLLGYSVCGGRGTCRVTGHVTSLVNGVSHVTHARHFAWLGMRSQYDMKYTVTVNTWEADITRSLPPIVSYANKGGVIWHILAMTTLQLSQKFPKSATAKNGGCRNICVRRRFISWLSNNARIDALAARLMYKWMFQS